MGDYGIRISKSGDDVKTAADKDLILTSKYSLLKGYATGSGQETLADGGSVTVTVDHNLGYIPIILAYAKPSGVANSFVNNKWALMPVTLHDASDTLETRYTSNATTLSLIFSWADPDGTNSVTIDYRYFIFYDKGNLF